MKLTYHRNGDYLLPDLGLTKEEQHPLGKYGRMRLRYLEEHRPGLYTRLLLSGKLMEHLQEIDSTCQERLEHLTRQMQAQEGVTEELKAVNQLEWAQRMNAIHHQIEEILLAELVFA
ncbi:MAG: TnpV protein [Candidatus Ventricola sp.]